MINFNLKNIINSQNYILSWTVDLGMSSVVTTTPQGNCCVIIVLIKSGCRAASASVGVKTCGVFVLLTNLLQLYIQQHVQ